MPFQQPWVEVKRATCQEAAVHWWNPDLPLHPTYWLITLTRSVDTEKTSMCFFFVKEQTLELYLPLLLTAGCEYRVSVAALTHAFRDKHVPSFVVSDEGAMDFRTGASSRYHNRVKIT